MLSHESSCPGVRSKTSKRISGGSGICFHSQWQKDSQLLSLHKHIHQFFALRGTFFQSFLSLVNMTLMVSVFSQDAPWRGHVSLKRLLAVSVAP